MKNEEIKVGQRLYHIIFGWCEVTHPVNGEGKTLINLDAKEISYYKMGEGYVSYKKDPQGQNIVYTPIVDLVKDEKVLLSKDQMLKRAAMNCTITY